MTQEGGSRRRVRARVEGVVQGVGFRPYVYRLAQGLGLDGFVLNDSRGVLVEVEAAARTGAVEAFLSRLAREAPALARVERVAPTEIAPTGEQGFAIRDSPTGGAPDALVSPDAATCAACLAELWDPADRRHRYPFVNCTDCGPRFTIVRGVPYDRARTTMAEFQMCALCRVEYEDPGNRRFHAEPNACPVCGPRAWLADRAGAEAPLAGAPDAPAAAARALLAGAIVAIKGIGGMHLACRADDERVVATLRGRKRREDKPFALMVASVDAAGALAEIGPVEETALLDAARPIVLCPRRTGAPAAPSVAPGSRDLGLMLPYSPLHHLIAADAGVPLVMTSGNLSDEPIAYRDEDALERLAPVADLLLLHDRPIQTRTDDSVVRALPGRPALVMRRSRGYVPASLDLPVFASRPLLAVGAQLKSTFCLARGRRAWVSHHIGDLQSWEVLRSFREGVAHFERLFDVRPEVVAHDLHPQYLSTTEALEREGVETVGVQHHHAHLAACLAEHGQVGPAVGAILDGTGYGTDGTIWGGEILVGDLAGFGRADHLRPVRMPGGEAAVRQPWRMAAAWLADALGTDRPPLPQALAGRVAPERWEAVARLATGAGAGAHASITTSAGRLLDAAAAICGLHTEVTYEGQAAIAFEAVCDPAERRAYPMDGLDPREALLALVADLDAGASVGVVAARVHAALARATADAVAGAAAGAGLDLAVLSGGVFQNRILLTQTAGHLERMGLRVLIPERLPPNDGGISYGQAAVAAAS